MSVTIEARILQLLTLDPVCQGQVSGTTVRALALEFAREPAPDGDVLAERADCLAVIRACRDRLLEQADPGDGPIRTEARRLGAAIEGISSGLHRSAPTPAKGA